MLKSTFSFWCASLYAMTLCNAQGSSETKECGDSQLHLRATARYTTPKGIGYNDGYTTLEGFFSTNPCDHDSWLPFLDLRGHVFDNGKLAANAGLGLRYLSASRVWGMNAYYDYRSTNRQHYNQIAAGFESLGRVWDFRINGYLPVGWRQSPHFHTRFYSFLGNSLLIKYKKDFAMKGANAEAGFHLDHFKHAPLYFAAGPYYLTGMGKTAWGGELRATVEFFHRYLKLEGNTSYDHFFKWIGQGQVSVNIPLGKRCKIAKKETCKEDRLFARAIQRVDRHEIIPVGRRKIVTPANNPATGKPWVFWFVNNTSHSSGTFEDPFPTLLGAQNASSANQAIYVYPGDGTTNGMSNGITLKNGQPFLSATVAHSIPTTKGTVLIPPMASGLLSITNTTGNVITVGNNTTVSGFNILITANGSSGIFGNDVSNLVTNDNTFVTSTSMTTNGITLNNPTNQIVIQDNTFDGFTNNDGSNNGNGVYISGGTVDTLNVSGNTLMNISNPGAGNGGSGLFMNTTRVNRFTLMHNQGRNDKGVTIGTGSVITTFTSADNTFSDMNSSVGVLNSGTITNFSSSGDTFSSLISSFGILNTGTINTFIVSGDTFNGLTTSVGIGNSGTITNFSTLGNTFSSLSNSNAITNFSTGTITNFGSSGNTFSDLSLSVGISNQGTITTFSSSNNIFSGLSFSDGINNSLNITSFSSTSDTFSGLSNSIGIIYSLASGSADVSISNDTFIVGTSPFNGFATTINVTGGTLCLEFIDNTATVLTPPPYAYVFNRTSGIFNSTSNSTTSANTGTFSISSGVSFPGTCTVAP
jgi:hypothetical protein